MMLTLRQRFNMPYMTSDVRGWVVISEAIGRRWWRGLLPNTALWIAGSLWVTDIATS